MNWIENAKEYNIPDICLFWETTKLLRPEKILKGAQIRNKIA